MKDTIEILSQNTLKVIHFTVGSIVIAAFPVALIALLFLGTISVAGLLWILEQAGMVAVTSLLLGIFLLLRYCATK